MPLGEVCTITKKQGGTRPLPYVGLEDIASGGAGSFLGSLDPQTDKSTTFEFEPGHVLYGRLRPYLNKVLLPDFVGHCSSEIFPLLPLPQLDRGFLFHWLTSQRTVDAINATCTGARMPRANVSELMTFPISLPPLDEQKRIVVVLDEAFEGLSRAHANAEANLADARDLFAVQIEELILSSGGLEVSLEKLIESGAILSHFDGNHGENYPRKEEFTDAGVPYLSANCIVGNEVDFSRAKFLPDGRADTLKKGTSKDRDILFAHNATVGPVALLRTELPRVLLSTSLTHYRCNEEAIIPEFLLVEMQSAAFVRQYETVMRQATRNQVPISAQRKFTHIVPPLKEQKRIAEISTQLREDVSDLVRVYEQAAFELTYLRQSLLQKAFSGELT